MVDMSQIVGCDHGFVTNQGDGHLILRSIHPNEATQYHTIRSDPINNQFYAVVSFVEFTIYFAERSGHHRYSTRGIEAGILIHHKFAGHHYGKEAFIAALDYVLLGKTNCGGSMATI